MTSVPFFQWRGSPIRVGFDVQALAESGYEVDLLTIPVGEDRSIPGVTVHRVWNPMRIKSMPIGPSFGKALFDILLLFAAVTLAFRRRYAVIHAVEELGIIAWFIARLVGAKVVFEKHSDPESHRDRPLKNLVLSAYRRLEAVSIRLADSVIATGEGLEEQARAVAPEQKVYHIFDIPSSLVDSDPARVLAVRAKLKQAPDEVVALYVGSFAVYQGIDLLFESFALALKSKPSLRLVVVGGKPYEIAARRAWLEEREIAGRVTFLGFVAPDKLPNYTAAADILVSSRISGINTPLKLLDYMKAGRAILATNNEANRKLVDERCALLAPATPEGFAAGFVELAADEERREILGRAGRQRVEEVYNFAEFKKLLKDCYDGVLAE